MKYEEFLTKLGEGRGKFRLDYYGGMRTTEDHLCPLQFVFGQQGYITKALREDLAANSIMMAADHNDFKHLDNGSYVTQIRNDMLKTLGLE